MLATSATLVVTAALTVAAHQTERAALERALQDKADEEAVRIATMAEIRKRGIERIATRWEYGVEPLGRDAWVADATTAVVEYIGLFAVFHQDATGLLAWTAPPGQEDAARAAMEAPEHQAALQTARRRGGTVFSHAYMSPSATVSVVTELRRAGAFEGWVVGLLDVPTLVGTAVMPMDGYRVQVWQGSVPLLDPEAVAERRCGTAPVEQVGTDWVVEVCASPGFVDAFEGPIPAITLAVGLTISALVGGLTRALGVASERANRARELAGSLAEQADALGAAQRELAELSYSVSHELRAPLRAIDGYAAMLAKECPAEVEENTARIRVNAQRMARQLDGLLELLRVARAEVRLRPVDVSAMARERLGRRAEAEPERAVEFRVEDGIAVTGDEVLLGSALDAVIDNAWKFSACRTVAHIEVSRTPTGFLVRDDGVGFDMAFADKLFRTFERLHSPGEFEGLGLGLALAARAVARQGGRIRAEGRPGTGATLYVDLPPAVRAVDEEPRRHRRG